MGYRVYYNFSDGTTEDLLDEVFATKKEAVQAALEGKRDFMAGNAILQMGGHDDNLVTIIGYEIEQE